MYHNNKYTLAKYVYHILFITYVFQSQCDHHHGTFTRILINYKKLPYCIKSLLTQYNSLLYFISTTNCCLLIQYSNLLYFISILERVP